MVKRTHQVQRKELEEKKMEDITCSDTKYTRHIRSDLQRPHDVALNKERMWENLVWNFDRGDKQATHAHENAKSEALEDPLGEFFEQYKDPRT